MTPTTEQIALARRIAANQYPDDPIMQEALLTGPVERAKSYQAALAAITETTERAAAWLEGPNAPRLDRETEIAGRQYGHIMACSEGLRAGEHLKGSDNG